MESQRITVETLVKKGYAELRLFSNATQEAMKFTQESELARHVEAALWVLGREG
jgi:hypothetical protein